uniref:Uncharacterized protein n=1 Tax=Plectus sambesii TaxID=2011161 RepID=A0A914X9P9_9BILA
MCRKEPRAKQFFLFNDVLVYGRIVKTNELFDNQRIIPLQDVVVETLPDAAEYYLVQYLQDKLSHSDFSAFKQAMQSVAVFSLFATGEASNATHINRLRHECMFCIARLASGEE